MSKALLCSTGESVAIWEVGSGLEPVYQFDIGDGQSNIISWNQNSTSLLNGIIAR